MAKKLDIRGELAHRNYKRPNPFLYFIYYFVGLTPLLGGKYHPKYKVIDKIEKGPAFLIWNHQSRRDHTFLTSLAWPRRLSIVCEEASFFREHLHWPFKMNGILPKKVFSNNDLQGIRNIRKIIKQGGVVALSPEGTSSIFGDNQPIVPGTGRFLQSFKVPIYIVDLKGSYLTNNKVTTDDRPGKVYGELRRLFSKEEIAAMKPEDIDNKINEAFHHDDYKWNKVARIKYQSNGKMTTNLSDILYKCPRCGKEFNIEAKDSYIKCLCCGNGATMDEYYDFHPFDDTSVIPDTPTDWVHSERLSIIDEIRKDKNYSFSFKCKIGDLPNDHYVPKTDTSEICGEGIYTIDHQGVHFRGTKRGEPFNFDLSYKQIWTYPMTVDLSIFSINYDNELYDIYPEYRCVGKAIMLTEEMHRLHINYWKNFPWFDYMYKGKPLGIDLKDNK